MHLMDVVTAYLYKNSAGGGITAPVVLCDREDRLTQAEGESETGGKWGAREERSVVTYKKRIGRQQIEGRTWSMDH